MMEFDEICWNWLTGSDIKNANTTRSAWFSGFLDDRLAVDFQFGSVSQIKLRWYLLELCYSVHTKFTSTEQWRFCHCVGAHRARRERWRRPGLHRSRSHRPQNCCLLTYLVPGATVNTIDARHQFFSNLVVDIWNYLLAAVVLSPSVAVFKRNLATLTFSNFLCYSEKYIFICVYYRPNNF